MVKGHKTIPHTADTESLKLSRQYHQQQNIKNKYYIYLFSFLLFHQVPGVRCHMSHVTCRVSPVPCPMSVTPTALATDPPPANSPSTVCTAGWQFFTISEPKMQYLRTLSVQYFPFLKLFNSTFHFVYGSIRKIKIIKC